MRVRDFDKKPKPIKERIIQEARATRLGEKISKKLAQFFQENINGNLQLGIRVDEYQKWIVQCLKRPGNRKFLAQKAIEWFSKRKK